MPYVVGIVLSIGVAAFARSTGFDRDRAFYPTVMIVIASYYVLFAATSGSVQTVVIESVVMTLFAAAASNRFARSTDSSSLPAAAAHAILPPFCIFAIWGARIALVGAMLVYGACKPAVRPMALTVASASKAIFVALVLSHGGRFLGYQAGIAVLIDALWVMVFAAYLLSVRRPPTGDLQIGSVGTA